MYIYINAYLCTQPYCTSAGHKKHEKNIPNNAGSPAQLTNGLPLHNLPPLGEGLKPDCTPERLVITKTRLLTIDINMQQEILAHTYMHTYMHDHKQSQ